MTRDCHNEPITIREDFEVDYWTSRIGVPRAQLRQAVRQAGNRIDDVLAYLRAQSANDARMERDGRAA